MRGRGDIVIDCTQGSNKPEPGYINSKFYCLVKGITRVGHLFFSKERSVLCVLLRSL